MATLGDVSLGRLEALGEVFEDPASSSHSFPIRPPTPTSTIFHLILDGRSESLPKKTLFSLSKGGKVLEIAVWEQFFPPTRFSLVKSSVQDMVADRNPY